jgi:hypothetical protein
MLSRLSTDAHSVVFAFLSIHELFHARAACRALHSQLDWAAAPRVWAGCRPPRVADLIHRCSAPVAQALHAVYGIPADRDAIVSAFDYACACGLLEKLVWLDATFDLAARGWCAGERGITSACDNGHLEAAEWCARTFAPVLRVEYAAIAHQACTDGRLDIAGWCLQWRHAGSEEPHEATNNATFATICARGHLSAAMWFVEHFRVPPHGSGPVMAIARAREGPGPAAMIAWLRATYPTKLNMPAFIYDLCDAGHLGLAQRLAPQAGLLAPFAYNIDLRNALALASSAGHITVVTWLLQSIALGSRSIGARDCIWPACAHGQLEMLQWLAATHGGVMGVTHMLSGFASACARGHVAVAKWIAAKYALHTTPGVATTLRSAFKDACATGHEAAARWLVARFAGVKWDTDVALRCAATGGYIRLARWLVTWVPPVVLRQSEGDQALKVVCRTGCLEDAAWVAETFNLHRRQVSGGALFTLIGAVTTAPMLEWLLVHFELTDARWSTTLTQMCAARRFDLARQLMTHLEPMLAGDARIVLSAACAHADLAMVRWFAAQQPFQFRSADQFNALNWACVNGNLAVAQCVVERFPRGQTWALRPDTRGALPSILGRTCIRGSLDVVKWFVAQYEAHLDALDAARWACVHGQLEVLQWLIDHFGLAPEDVHPSDETLLSACWYGSLNTVRWTSDRMAISDETGRKMCAIAIARHKLALAHWLVTRFRIRTTEISYLANDEAPPDPRLIDALGGGPAGDAAGRLDIAATNSAQPIEFGTWGDRSQRLASGLWGTRPPPYLRYLAGDFDYHVDSSDDEDDEDDEDGDLASDKGGDAGDGAGDDEGDGAGDDAGDDASDDAGGDAGDDADDDAGDDADDDAGGGAGDGADGAVDDGTGIRTR